MTILKHCAGCSTDKPYNPEVRTGTKANGFKGKYCWECSLMQEKVGRAPGFRERYARIEELWNTKLRTYTRP